jgi:hypothetical protein
MQLRAISRNRFGFGLAFLGVFHKKTPEKRDGKPGFGFEMGSFCRVTFGEVVYASHCSRND